MKKIITGVKPTGQSMHLGNLLGAVLPFQEIAHANDASIFIADLHALNSVFDGELLRTQSHELAVEYLSIYGKDTPIRIFRQSDIHKITKLQWILSNATPYSLLLRAHSFKDAEAKKSEISMGVFNYPVLMAADILGYNGELVPVGKDQLQHLEMTRDIARSFNRLYNRDIFIEPEAMIKESVATLPGIDGRKMSKSYNNFIGVFDDEAQLKKRVMSIVTDSRGVNDEKDPSTCNVFALIEAFALQETREEIRKKYITPNSGYGYGHAKQDLLGILIEYLREYRERRQEILADPKFVEKKLAEGADIMNARLEVNMKIIESLLGIH